MCSIYKCNTAYAAQQILKQYYIFETIQNEQRTGKYNVHYHDEVQGVL